MVFTKLLLGNALAIRPCNYAAASEPPLPRVFPLHASSLIALYRKVRRPCFELRVSLKFQKRQDMVVKSNTVYVEKKIGEKKDW